MSAGTDFIDETIEVREDLFKGILHLGMRSTSYPVCTSTVIN